MSDAPPREKSPDEYFEGMARRIVVNTHSDFAGAFVVCVPGIEPMEMLLLNPDPNPAILLSTLKTMIEMKMSELQDKASNQRGRGGW